jgi:parvulin-like peptidyl-prolyl isomerase
MHELARREMELRAEALRGEDHDAALREAFARMQSRGEGMVRFHVGGIAFGPPDAESLRSAQALLKQISSGETDFETAAREHSIDPSAASDGDLGWFNVRTLAARDWMMMRAVRQIEPGELSGLIHSADGLWIYRLHARQSGEQVRFEDVRDELEARLEQRQTQTLQRQVRAAIVRGVEFAEPAAINSRIEITAPNQPVGGD